MALLCWPVLEGRGTILLGDELGHGWRAVWTANRTWQSLSAGQGWPLRADDLAAPVGGPMVSPSPLFDALSVPLRSWLGPISTFDALAVAHLLLGAFGGHALGRQAGLRGGGALVAGTVFGFNALMLSAGAASGAPEVLGMAWVPLALASLCWLLRAPGLGPALATAATTIAMGLADPHLALFAPLVALALVLPWLVERAGQLRRREGAWVADFGWVALGVGAAAVVLGRALGPLFAAAMDPDALLPPGSLRPGPLTSPDALQGALDAYATLSGVLLPTDGNTLRGHGAASTTVWLYAGWISLALAAAGARLGRLRWLALSVVSLILAMGPYLLVTPDGWRPVPVPWWTWLSSTWPQYGMVQSYVRALAFGFAGLAVLAGAGADLLIARLGGSGAVAVGLAGAILAETLGLSPLPTPLPNAPVWVPQAVTKLAELPRRGAVLDWPQREGSATDEIPRYAYYQLWHNRPIFADLSSGVGPTGLEGNPFFAALEKVTYGEGYRSRAWGEASALPVSDGVRAIGGMGYAYLVLHPWHLAPERREAVVSWLGETLTLAAQADDGSAVYAMRSRSSEAPSTP